MAMTRQLCTFTVGDLRLGVDVGDVREVLRRQPTTPVPLAHDDVAGLINLRGEIVTALDLRRRFDLPPADREYHMNVVLVTEEEPVSLVVDSIGEVVTVSEDDFERPPDTASAATATLIVGAYKLEGQLLLLLDTAKALATASV